MFYYIYKLIHKETGEFYFGSRKSKVEPEKDIAYQGSMVRWKPDKSLLDKVILKSDFLIYEDLIHYEIQIILQHKNDPLNRNYSIPNSKFFLTKSEDTIGEKNGFYGKHHTVEHKIQVSKKLEGENNPSYNKKWINKDGCQKFVSKNDLQSFLDDGWSIGNITSSAYKEKRLWITNGTENRYLKESEFVLPEGWRRGKTYSDEAKKKFKDMLKKVPKDSPAYKKGSVWMNDGIRNYKLQESEGILKGLVKGRLGNPWNKKQ
jgi:hypothetical protein